ncbi:MAG: hypothetical protein J7L39_01605 [Candidatus Aenigmarchaeota archaeon]|nr:hypothetical protein [Candidatus Aenigmarchaeota archaeon]
MNSSPSNLQRKNLIKYILLFLFFVFLGLMFKYLEEKKFSTEISCPLFSSNISCINEGLEIWFYNPNNVSVYRIKIIVPTMRGRDIYNVKEPLEAHAIKKLRLNYCYRDRRLEEFTIEWCCNKSCFREKLNNLIRNFSVEPEVPKEPMSIEECDSISNEIKRLFCIADVAEIKNNITLCYEIKNPDIFYHCIARVELNASKCTLILDEELKKACVESVELKKKFYGLE